MLWTMSLNLPLLLVVYEVLWHDVFDAVHRGWFLHFIIDRSANGEKILLAARRWSNIRASVLKCIKKCSSKCDAFCFINSLLQAMRAMRQDPSWLPKLAAHKSCGSSAIEDAKCALSLVQMWSTFMILGVAMSIWIMLDVWWIFHVRDATL